MTLLFQANTMSELGTFLGSGIIHAFGGSALILGLAILLAIGIICWRLNVHLTSAYFLSFIALTFLKEYLNTSTTTDIGLFGTLYNIMLFGMALVTVSIIHAQINR